MLAAGGGADRLTDTNCRKSGACVTLCTLCQLPARAEALRPPIGQQGRCRRGAWQPRVADGRDLAENKRRGVNHPPSSSNCDRRQNVSCHGGQCFSPRDDSCSRCRRQAGGAPQEARRSGSISSALSSATARGRPRAAKGDEPSAASWGVGVPPAAARRSRSRRRQWQVFCAPSRAGRRAAAVPGDVQEPAGGAAVLVVARRSCAGPPPGGAQLEVGREVD